MKKNEVKVGGFYTAKVSDKLVTVRIDSTHSRSGWSATNTRTGKRIHIKSAQRLRSAAKSSASAEASEATKATVANDAKAVSNNKTPTRMARSKKVEGALKPKRLSALDAAAQVLKETNKPMRATELIDAMAEQNLWKSPGGKTPYATLYAAMQREERDKGEDSRFKKVDRGLFEYHAPKSA